MRDIPKEISIDETETEQQTKKKIKEETGLKTETETVNPTDDNMQIKTVSFPWFVNAKFPLTVVTSFFLFYHYYHL